MTNLFYDISRVLSYSEPLLYILIGERGVGKTYSLTKWLIRRFLKTGKQFVYLRRYKTELASGIDKFFDAMIKNNEFPNNKLTTSKDKIYIDGQVAGFGIALSTANILKGSEYAKVDVIFYDEFIIDKGSYHYLPQEPRKLLDLIETTGRMRDMRVFLVGNAITVSNPYFLYFDLTLPYNTDIALFKNNLILVNYIKNEAYREAKKNTKFGRLIDGTDYGRYAIDNEFLYDRPTFIKPRPKDSRFFFIIKISENHYGVWLSDAGIFISKKFDSKCPIKFSFDLDSHDETTLRIRIRTSPFMKRLILAYDESSLYFENIKIKNAVMGVLSKYLV